MLSDLWTARKVHLFTKLKFVLLVCQKAKVVLKFYGFVSKIIYPWLAIIKGLLDLGVESQLQLETYQGNSLNYLHLFIIGTPLSW